MATINKKFAIFLCYFKDSPNKNPRSKNDYENAFLNGDDSIFRYWMDNSGGQCDISMSQVFGWSEIDMPIADFLEKICIRDSKGSKIPILDNHGDVIDFKRNRALSLDIMIDKLGIIDVSKLPVPFFGATSLGSGFLFNGKYFDYIIGVFADNVKEYGAYGVGIVASANDYGSSHSFLCHEMAHVMLDLGHSRDRSKRDGSGGPGVYLNRTDLMSVENNMSAAHGILGHCGPNLCSIYRKQLGWIPPHRIYNYTGDGPNSVVLEIISRSHPEIDGIEVIEFSNLNLYIEFVSKEKWDNGVTFSGLVLNEIILGYEPIPRKVYTYAQVIDTEYRKWDLMTDQELQNVNDSQIWRVGNVYGDLPGKSDSSILELFKSRFYIEILNINPEAHKATIRINNVPPKYRWPKINGFVTPGVKSDGGGGVIVGGKFKPIPPRGWRRLFAQTSLVISSFFIRVANTIVGKNNQQLTSNNFDTQEKLM